MTRDLFGCICVLALGIMPMVGCGETSGPGGMGGGTGGEGGDGGMGGVGGTGGTDLCEGVSCQDSECRSDGACDPIDGACDYEAIVEDGTACSEGECLDGVCGPLGAFPCTEQGIRDAIAEGGGPHFFACDGTTPVVTKAEILIDNDVVLDGEGDLAVDGNEDHRVFSVATGVTAELRGLTATRGVDSGISNSRDATLTLMNSTVSGNTGGTGLFNRGTLTLMNSTVSGNTGEGIFNQGGTMTLVNSTVSGNTGEGIFNQVGTVMLTNSTVSGKTDDSIYNQGGTVTLTNSLVDGTCNPDPDIISNGYNIESPVDTCRFDQPTDQVNVDSEDLKLGPLQNNGGATMTHALDAGSIAVDAIREAECLDADGDPLTTDQRGEPRPETGGTMCDVGAFEVQP